MMRTILDVIDRYREAFTVMNHEVRYLARRPEHRHALGRIVDEYHSAVAGVLERGRKAGVINFVDRRSVVHAIHMLCAGWAMGGNNLKNVAKETYWREIAGIIEGRFFAPMNGNSNRAKEN
jgi:hypothetical protein